MDHVRDIHTVPLSAVTVYFLESAPHSTISVSDVPNRFLKAFGQTNEESAFCHMGRNKKREKEMRKVKQQGSPVEL